MNQDIIDNVTECASNVALVGLSPVGRRVVTCAWVLGICAWGTNGCPLEHRFRRCGQHLPGRRRPEGFFVSLCRLRRSTSRRCSIICLPRHAQPVVSGAD
jgi:hypothetical protein